MLDTLYLECCFKPVQSLTRSYIRVFRDATKIRSLEDWRATRAISKMLNRAHDPRDLDLSRYKLEFIISVPTSKLIMLKVSKELNQNYHQIKHYEGQEAIDIYNLFTDKPFERRENMEKTYIKGLNEAINHIETFCFNLGVRVDYICDTDGITFIFQRHGQKGSDPIRFSFSSPATTAEYIYNTTEKFVRKYISSIEPETLYPRYMMAGRSNGKTQSIKNYFNEKYGLGCTKPPVPKIKNVIFDGPATIVFWKDGTKTVVKCQEGDTLDPEKGLAMAITKKVLGNDYEYYNKFKKWLPKNTFKDIDEMHEHKDQDVAAIIEQGCSVKGPCSTCKYFDVGPGVEPCASCKPWGSRDKYVRAEEE